MGILFYSMLAIMFLICAGAALVGHLCAPEETDE